jgi:hypothetical protein
MTIDRYRINHWSARLKKARPMIHGEMLILAACIISLLFAVSFSLGYQYGQEDCQYSSWRQQ